jgi:hypothetical protein
MRIRYYVAGVLLSGVTALSLQGKERDTASWQRNQRLVFE